MEDCFFDASSVEPLSGFDPIPEGEYEVVITKSQSRPTKSGTGSYLELTCQVAAGDHAGRLLWARLNLKNPNPAAVEMAKRELSAICHAAGVLRPKTKEELHGIPVIARVCVREDSSGRPSNEIRGWKAKPAGAPPAGPAPAQPATASPGAAPWAR